MAISSINRLRQMAIFCHVIESGSMRAAGDKLGLTPSAISQHLTQLESELEVTLIYRSTRKLSLSEAGQRYYQHVKKMLMSASDADDAINEVKHSLEGDLRISAPVGLAARPLAKALQRLLEGNAGLSITVLAHDRSIDLVAEQIDIALRVGKPVESNHIYHALGNISKGIYASPEYLKKRGNPVSPNELTDHLWLGSISKGDFSDIALTHTNDQSFNYKPKYRMQFNDINVLTQHIQQGFGLGVLPDLEVQHLVEAGMLIRLLPEWTTQAHNLYALTIDRKQSYKVNAALKELKTYFSET